jgi:HAMP domain-containing protein
MSPWAYVFAAYGLVAAVLLVYWRRVERRIRDREREPEHPR